MTLAAVPCIITLKAMPCIITLKAMPWIITLAAMPCIINRPGQFDYKTETLRLCPNTI